jgi:hypothetical protein
MFLLQTFSSISWKHTRKEVKYLLLSSAPLLIYTALSPLFLFNSSISLNFCFAARAFSPNGLLKRPLMATVTYRYRKGSVGKTSKRLKNNAIFIADIASLL